MARIGEYMTTTYKSLSYWSYVVFNLKSQKSYPATVFTPNLQFGDHILRLQKNITLIPVRPECFAQLCCVKCIEGYD